MTKGEVLELDASRRISRKQRIITTSLFYVQNLCQVDAVSNHDLHRWLVLQDPNTALSQPSTLAVLNRLEEREVTGSLWEIPERLIHRPPRKFHHLTSHGVELAIQYIQELRADKDKPSWIHIPELEDGQWEPVNPDGFELQPPEGRLVLPTDQTDQ